MSCPITRAITRSFDKSHELLNEDLFDPWNVLDEAIEKNKPSDDDLKLRSFYIVELGYRVFIPSAIKRSSMNEDVQAVFASQWFSRSAEGLAELIQTCEQQERRLVINKGVYQLCGPKLAGNANGDVFTIPRRMRGSVTSLELPSVDLCVTEVAICLKMAKHLRSSLRGPMRRPSCMGGFLFDALEALGKANMEDLIGVASALLSINSGNVLSPMRFIL